MKRRITCHCEHAFDIDTPDAYDLSPGSGTRKEVLDGTFLTIPCPNCGTALRPEFPLTLTDGSRERHIFLVPEIERDRFLLGKYPIPQGVEVVIGFRELRESLCLADDGYDRRAIELLKYHILLRAKGNGDVRIYYTKTLSQELTFHIHGLRPEEIAVMHVPLSAYERTVTEIETRREEEPLKTLLEEPYVSVHKIDIDTGDNHE